MANCLSDHNFPWRNKSFLWASIQARWTTSIPVDRGVLGVAGRVERTNRAPEHHIGFNAEFDQGPEHADLHGAQRSSAREYEGHLVAPVEVAMLGPVDTSLCPVGGQVDRVPASSGAARHGSRTRLRVPLVHSPSDLGHPFPDPQSYTAARHVSRASSAHDGNWNACCARWPKSGLRTHRVVWKVRDFAVG